MAPRAKDAAWLTLRMKDEEAILDTLDRMQEAGMLPEGVAVYEASALDMPGGRASPRNFVMLPVGNNIGRELWPDLDPTLKDEYERRAARSRLRADGGRRRHATT